MTLVISGLFALLFLIWPPGATAQERCVQLALDDLSNSSGAIFAVVEEMYREAGLCVEGHRVPSKRIATMVEAGVLDGEGVRILPYIEQFAYLTHVPTPVWHGSGHVLMHKSHHDSVETGDDLAGLTIGITRGTKWQELLITRFKAEPVSLESSDQAFAMMALGRIDGMLIDDLTFKIHITANSLDPSQFWVSPPILSTPAFHPISVRRSRLLPRLDAAMARLSQSGRADLVLNNWMAENVEPTVRYTYVASNAWHPFSFEGKGESLGIIPEVTRLILERAGIKSRGFHASADEHEMAFARGFIDFEIASPSWFPGGQYPSGFMSSEPIFETRDVVVCPARGCGFKNLEGMYGRPVGTIKGYTYPDGDRLQRRDYENERDLIQAVASGNISAGIINEASARYWTRRDDRVVAYGPVHSAGDMTVRLRSALEGLMPAINESIQTLQASGEIKSIMLKYTR